MSQEGAAWRQALRIQGQPNLPAQMALIDRNMPVALWGTVAVAWLSGVTFWLALGHSNVWFWTLWVTLVGGVGLLLRGRFAPALATMQGALRYARASRVLWAVMGWSWGLLAWLHVRPEQPASTSLVLGMVAGLASAGLAVFGPSWPIAMGFWLGCALTTAAGLLAVQDAVHVALAGGVLIYLAAMTVYSYHTAQAAQRSIELHRDNEALVSQLRDQTLRAQAARQLAEEATAEAEAADRAKTVFLASVSHDLRQPLHAAGLFIGALSAMGLQGRTAHLLHQVAAAHTAAAEMLNTLLDFSRVEAGAVQPDPRPFALQPMLHRLVQELVPWAEEKGLALRLRDTRLVVHADPALVEMMVRNLLLNAIRYTDRGAVLLACRSRGQQVWVEVWDTGVGIPQHQQEAIFREFHQLGNPERDRRKGMGLGLAIVQGLARLMALPVRVSSVPGRGSVFRIGLPMAQPTLCDDVVVAPMAGELAGLKVMLVDDDEAVRRAMAELLTDWGCWCEVVDGLESALACLRRFEPDVLLCDHRLSGERSGLQVVERIWGQLRRRVPSALVTADTAGERLREAQASGLTLLHKPVSVNQLHAALLALGGRVPAAAAQPREGDGSSEPPTAG